jgi:hypothetical protein
VKSSDCLENGRRMTAERQRRSGKGKLHGNCIKEAWSKPISRMAAIRLQRPLTVMILRSTTSHRCRPFELQSLHRRSSRVRPPDVPGVGMRIIEWREGSGREALMSPRKHMKWTAAASRPPASAFRLFLFNGIVIAPIGFLLRGHDIRLLTQKSGAVGRQIAVRPPRGAWH